MNRVWPAGEQCLELRLLRGKAGPGAPLRRSKGRREAAFPAPLIGCGPTEQARDRERAELSRGAAPGRAGPCAGPSPPPPAQRRPPAVLGAGAKARLSGDPQAGPHRRLAGRDWQVTP
ncbi:Hypothetical predicted protein [Podarcis lilfordi]|uniref:Uncharacterized protein n=1 Tax=Podarcis lilfordi TaxID=74358 RepID=A0AA35K194_9SAUR|nr:Hypothetical predicted protein [Podarcis lilfordi]